MSTLWPSLLWGAQEDHANGLFNTALPDDRAATRTEPHLGASQLQLVGVVPETPFAISGSYNPGVNDTFYNRILIEPAVLTMGNLLSNQTRPVRIWNGFIATKSLTDFQRTGADGINVQEPVTTPYTMKPLEELTYVLSVTTDGPAVISALFKWTVDGIDYTSEVTGRRVVIWPFGPSWDAPLTETLSALTNVLRSYSGDEQRRGLRSKLRRTLSYQFKTARTDSARLENLLLGWQNRVYAVPVWTDKSALLEATAAGSNVLKVKTDTYGFAVGGLAIVYQDKVNMEVVEIAAVTPGVLGLLRPSERPWAMGTAVFPVILGHLPTRVPVTRLTSQAMIGSLTFTADPTTNDSHIPNQVAPISYNGHEVLTRQPNWKSGLTNDYEYIFDTIDAEVGAINWDDTEEFPRVIRQYSWMLSNRKQIYDFRAMLGRRMGQLKPIYLPTWHDDFKVMRTIGAADNGIYVLNNEFLMMVGTAEWRDRLMIRIQDGTKFYRKIVGLSSDGDFTLLTLDQSLGREVPLGGVKTMHLLVLNRLATDEVNIVWRTNEVAQVDTSFITIKA